MFYRVSRVVKSRAEVSEELNRVNSSQEELIKQRTMELETEVRIRKQKELESVSKARFLMDVIESLEHPFYVIDVETYEIELANNAAYDVIGNRGSTCYELTHHSNHPCDGLDHPCPLKKSYRNRCCHFRGACSCGEGRREKIFRSTRISY